MSEKPTLSLEERALEQRLANPCVQICVRDNDDGVCLGCGRTAQEINNWLNISRAEREAIIPLLDERIEQLPAPRRQRRTGRSNREKLRAERGLDT